MFNMSNNKFNNGNNVSTNTRLASFFSDTCLLTVTAWNENISLKFAPYKGEDANGLRLYAQDRSEIISTSLMTDNAIALADAVKDVIEPALKDKKEAEVSVTIGSGENKKVLKVSTDGKDVTLSIFLGVDENGVCTGDKISHKFAKREYMTSYDPTTGKNESVEVNSDFENFMLKIKDINTLSGMTAHSINHSNAIKNAYKSNSNGFLPNNNYNSQPAQTPVTNYSSMDEFLPFN